MSQITNDILEIEHVTPEIRLQVYECVKEHLTSLKPDGWTLCILLARYLMHSTGKTSLRVIAPIVNYFPEIKIPPTRVDNPWHWWDVTVRDECGILIPNIKPRLDCINEAIEELQNKMNVTNK